MKINIAFCPHFHQPHFQLYKTREEAFRNCYEPWLELLEEMVDDPDFYINLHFSGPFMTWMAREKPEYMARLKKMVNRPGAGVIGGLADEAFAQLSARPDDILYQVMEYERMTQDFLGVTAADWEGIHIVEREAGEWLLNKLAHASRTVGAPPLFYLDAETYYESFFRYPGGPYDYCRKHFDFDDAHSKTTVAHYPEELLFFALRDEIGGQSYYSLPVHTQFRYRLLKRQAFGHMDKSIVKPRQYLFYIKDAAEKAWRAVRELGREIDPIVLIFEDAEKFGQWSKDPAGDAEWLREFFRLVKKDPDMQFCGMRSYLESQGYLDTYPAATSHSYAEWENWTGKRGVRGVTIGDERLRKVIARQRDVESKLEYFEKMILDSWIKDWKYDEILQDMVINSSRRYELLVKILEENHPQWLRAYRVIQRIRNLVYQEDPRWASRHPSYGSCAYFDIQGLGYLELAERLLDKLIAEQSGKSLVFPEIAFRDWDEDGSDEIVVRTENQMLVIDTLNGHVKYQQANVQSDISLTELVDMLDEDMKIPVAYSDIQRKSFPLIFTETDSDLAQEMDHEGGRIERCRNGFRIGFASLREGQCRMLPYEIISINWPAIEAKDGQVLIKAHQKIVLDDDGVLMPLQMIKSFLINNDSIQLSVEVAAEFELKRNDIYLVPELLTSMVPSDEVDFKPHSLLAVQGTGITKYEINRYDSISQTDLTESADLPIPQKIAYVCDYHNGHRERFTNTAVWDIDCSNSMDRVVIEPAVKYYYRDHVFPAQSRLGFDASGISIKPHINIRHGKADFKATFSWILDGQPELTDYDHTLVLLKGAQDDLYAQKIGGGSMILEQFFTYYFDRVGPEISGQLMGVMPEGMDRTPDNLAAMFRQNDVEALDFLLRFHTALDKIKADDPCNCITFNNADNVCFPFFIEYLWDRLPEEVRQDITAHFGTNEMSEVVASLTSGRDARNWFRRRVASVLTQDDLFTLNEVIALQNFSSGGEYSFLSLVLPDIKNLQGKVLDAGCGAGFASLVMSQHLDVCGIDACEARLNRARGLADLMKKGETNFFPRILKLIEDELGTIAGEVHFPKADELLTGKAKDTDFVHGSLDALPYQDQSFDAILCMDVLEHTYDPSAVIKQFARVAKPGAPVFITAPNTCGEIHQKFAEDEEGTAFPAMLHMHHFEPETLNAIFEGCGFETVRIMPFDCISKDQLAKMIKNDDAEGQALLARCPEEVPTQLFAVYRKK